MMEMAYPKAEPATVVVFGGTGDLMRKKLLPALYQLSANGRLSDRTRILAVTRTREMDDDKFRAWALQALQTAGLSSDGRAARWCEECLSYQGMGSEQAEDYRALARRIDALESAQGLPANRAFYLALPPQAFPGVIGGLGDGGLNRSAGWTRLVIEKPFGRDLASAQELNRLIHRHFAELQVYRIDHYLGKETVQNLLVFRFANPTFETLWTRDRVQSVQITVAEDVGIEGRAGYYERAGALRDIIQNHLTQLLTLVAMEVPGALEADQIRNEKVKVLRAISPVTQDCVVFGQYAAGQVDGRTVPGYREEPGVARDSQIDTFAALRVEIANWRWHGVPFYLRAGKRMPRRLTQIVVTFRRPPASVFQAISDPGAIHPNTLTIMIQPDEGFEFAFEVKAPGQRITLQTERLSFRYAEAFSPLPDAYETLLMDVLLGDQTLFVRADEAEAAWGLYAPVLDGTAEVNLYPAGSWGPAAADRLVKNKGERWIPA